MVGARGCTGDSCGLEGGMDVGGGRGRGSATATDVGAGGGNGMDGGVSYGIAKS